MTEAPITCSAIDDLSKAAKIMAERDCGVLPVVEDAEPQRPRGVITDRDIVMHTIAEGINPFKMKVADVMTNGAPVIVDNDPAETCLDVMQAHHVRCIVVVDDTGACCGIVTQAHIARHLDPGQVGEMVVKRASRPNDPAPVG